MFKTKLNGRVMAIRKHKKCVFIDLDTKEKTHFQLCFNEIPEFLPSRGDIISAFGSIGKSKTGQDTLFIETLNVLNKCDKPDNIDYNMKNLTIVRHIIESQARSALERNGAISVCTNVLTPFKGTSKIKPFETFDTRKNNYYLKITHELELKRFITDTQLPVYEIGPVFRDMGQDARHNREYKVLEAQFPYIELEQGLRIVMDVMQSIANKFNNTDFDNIPVFTLRQKFEELGYNIDEVSESYKKTIHKTKIKTQTGPFFLTNPPSEWSPLTLVSSDGKTALDADLVYKGKGISHICQERFLFKDIKKGLTGDESEFGNLDIDFLDHMALGMPPSTGFAIGLDRIASIFLNAKRIKDIIPYSR